MPLLAERGVHLSREQVYRLVTAPPQRLSMDTLAALCDILGATPNDLIEVTAQARQVRKPAAGAAAGRRGAADHDPPPRPATVTPAARQRARLTGQLARLLAGMLPGLAEEAAHQAVGQAARSVLGCRALLEHLQHHPDALRSGSAQVPAALVRLVHALAAAGTPGVALPGCAGCGKVTADLRAWPRPGLACQSCYKDACRQLCARCGGLARVAARGPDGPVCGRCYQRDSCPAGAVRTLRAGPPGRLPRRAGAAAVRGVLSPPAAAVLEVRAGARHDRVHRQRAGL